MVINNYCPVLSCFWLANLMQNWIFTPKGNVCGGSDWWWIYIPYISHTVSWWFQLQLVYTRKKFAKIPKIYPNIPKINGSIVYCIPEIQRKCYTEYQYWSCNITYTGFKKPLYTIYPKTLADPVECWLPGFKVVRRAYMVRCPYPRNFESLTICKWNLIQRQHFPLSYLKTLSVGVTVLNLNLWYPTWKSDAQPTEPLILGHPFIILFTEIFDHRGWYLSDFTMADGRRF